MATIREGCQLAATWGSCGAWLLVLVVAVEATWTVSLGRLAVLAIHAGAHAHHLGMDGSGHAVVHLAVDLGQGISCTNQVWIVHLTDPKIEQ